MLPIDTVPPLTDEADDGRCRATFNPVWPYVCAAMRGDNHTHVHFGQTCRWPRQPDYPPAPLDDEYDPFDVAAVCLS